MGLTIRYYVWRPTGEAAVELRSVHKKIQLAMEHTGDGDRLFCGSPEGWGRFSAAAAARRMAAPRTAVQ